MSPAPRLPSFRLDGQRALVTGAGRGIGAACAHALAQAGAEVWVAARTADEVRAVADAIGHDVHAIPFALSRQNATFGIALNIDLGWVDPFTSTLCGVEVIHLGKHHALRE